VDENFKLYYAHNKGRIANALLLIGHFK